MLNAIKVRGLVKDWVKDNKDFILGIATLAGVGVVGYKLGGKMTQTQISAGLQAMRADNALKFFDPATGLEVATTEGICDLIHRMNQ